MAATQNILTPDAEFVHDSGRLPLWIRCPAIVLAAGLWLLLADVVLDRVLHSTVRVFGGRSAPTPLGVVPALIGVALLALFFSHLWIGRKQILVLAASRQLVIRDRWFFGWFVKRLDRAAIERIEARFGRTVTGHFWNVQAIGKDDKASWLTRASSLEDAQMIAERLAGAVGCTVAVI